MRTLKLYNANKEELTSIPAFQGLTSLNKLAREHQGYAVLCSERKVFDGKYVDYVWDVDFYHNGEIVKRVENIDGLVVSERILQELQSLA